MLVVLKLVSVVVVYARAYITIQVVVTACATIMGRAYRERTLFISLYAKLSAERCWELKNTLDKRIMLFLLYSSFLFNFF